MDLQTFVSETLKQVMDAVAVAQGHAREVGAEVAPPSTPYSDGSGHYMPGDATGDTVRVRPARQVHMVEYDVAVTADEKEGNKAGIGVLSAVIALGAQATGERATGSVSRIKFRVPVAFPVQPK